MCCKKQQSDGHDVTMCIAVMITFPTPQHLESMRTLPSSPLPVTTVSATMMHLLPPHSDTAPCHPGLQVQQTPQQQPPPPGSLKRKKVDNGEDAGPAEPRRVRRSHEACARCRAKKIKASPIGLSLDHKPSSPLANITLPTTHSVIRLIQDVSLVQPPILLASKRTIIVRPSRLVAILSALSVNSSKAWRYSSSIFPVLI